MYARLLCTCEITCMLCNVKIGENPLMFFFKLSSGNKIHVWTDGGTEGRMTDGTGGQTQGSPT